MPAGNVEVNGADTWPGDGWNKRGAMMPADKGDRPRKAEKNVQVHHGKAQ